MSAELPDRIRVKISSEAAGEITLTPVVAQEMPLRELVEIVLGVCGRDAVRIRELLLRGSLVQGASRFRWSSLACEPAALDGLLATFPVADPDRRFDASLCVHARLCGAHAQIEMPKEAAAAKRLLQRRSFWDALMEIAARSSPHYVEYSYKYRADVYRLHEPLTAVREAAALLKYPGYTQQIDRADLQFVELIVARPPCQYSSIMERY